MDRIPPLLAAFTALAGAVAVLAMLADRRRGIGRLSFLPWDFVMVGAALLFLILLVRAIGFWMSA
ncbi:MAG: hypothetical protein SNJ63_00895 [Sphingomonadaceae bacterium]